MTKTLVVVVLSALLCFQLMQCMPTHENEVERLTNVSEAIVKPIEATSSADAAENIERNLLFAYTLGELNILAKITLAQERIIVDKVIDDVSNSDAKSESLQERITSLTEFSNKATKSLEESDDINDFFQLVEEFSDVVEKYNTTSAENVVQADKQIALLLQKYGSENVENEFKDRFLAFTQRFEIAVNRYISLLTPNEKQNELKLTNWYKKFVDEQSFEKKLEAFEEFFELH